MIDRSRTYANNRLVEQQLIGGRSIQTVHTSPDRKVVVEHNPVNRTTGKVERVTRLHEEFFDDNRWNYDPDSFRELKMGESERIPLFTLRLFGLEKTIGVTISRKIERDYKEKSPLKGMSSEMSMKILSLLGRVVSFLKRE